MNRLTLLSAGAALAAACVLATPAFAAYGSPTLIVDSPNEQLARPGPVTITLRQARADAPTAQLVVYVPRGYVSLFGQPSGTQLGAATAQTVSRTAPNAVVPAAGVIRVENPANYAVEAAKCVKEGDKVAAVWLLALTVSGKELNVPIFATTIASGPEAAFASAKLTMCLRSPEIADEAGGEPNGLKLFETRMTLRGVFVNPATTGEFRWTSLWTPYAVGGAAPDVLETVETQSIVRLPTRLSLSARHMKKRARIELRGSLTQSAGGVGAMMVTIAGGRPNAPRRIVRVKTSPNGTFVVTLRTTARGAYSFRATAARKVQTTACRATFAPVTCLRATGSSFAVAAQAKVRVKAAAVSD